MRNACFATATVLAVVVYASASAQTITYRVDCSKGGSIAGALARGDAREPLVIEVVGTCSERVAIRRDDVTIRGDPARGGAVQAPDQSGVTILIQGDRARLENVEVVGGSGGVEIAGPVFATLAGVTVRSPGSAAVAVRGGGDIAISGSTLTQSGLGLNLVRGSSARVFGNSEVRNNTGTGIFAGNNSTVAVGPGSKIRDNGLHGVELRISSVGNINGAEVTGNSASGIAATASQATIGGNLVSDNGMHGVLAEAGSAVFVDNNTIRDNQQNGVFGYLGATVVMHGNEITGNETGVLCRSDCTLQMGGVHSYGNYIYGVHVLLGSRLILETPVTDAAGNLGPVDLLCSDTESSVDGLAEYFVGTTLGCTDFNN